jgi:hypothetical protein
VPCRVCLSVSGRVCSGGCRAGRVARGRLIRCVSFLLWLSRGVCVAARLITCWGQQCVGFKALLLRSTHSLLLAAPWPIERCPFTRAKHSRLHAKIITQPTSSCLKGSPFATANPRPRHCWHQAAMRRHGAAARAACPRSWRCLNAGTHTTVRLTHPLAVAHVHLHTSTHAGGPLSSTFSHPFPAAALHAALACWPPMVMPSATAQPVPPCSLAAAHHCSALPALPACACSTS